MTKAKPPDYSKMDPERAKIVRRGGIMLAQSVRGTARQKVLRLVRDPVALVAVDEFGTRRQRRAAQRARSTMEKRAKLPKRPTHSESRAFRRIVLDDPYRSQ